MDWQQRWGDKLRTPAEAAASIQSGEQVYIGMFTSCPLTFAGALAARAPELDDITIHHHVSNFPWRQVTGGRFKTLTGFTTPVDRGDVCAGDGDYFPVGSFNPAKFIEYAPAVDTMAVTLSPPDENGYLSYGTAVWLNPSYTKKAKRIIAEIDPRLIRTYGENAIHVSEIDMLIEHDEGDDRAPAIPPRSQEVEDAANVICALVAAELIDDGDTLQTGIGDVSAAIGLFLDDKHELGVQTEMLGGGFVDLVEKGIVTGQHKVTAPGKVIASAVVQVPPDEVRRMHLHPKFELWDFCHTDDLRILVQNPNFVAINNALFVDLTGQVTAESMGPQVFSGPGGQTVFAVAASYSDGGRSIQVLPSSSVVDGERRSRIQAVLPEGTQTTVPRTYVDYVVTEHGIATLRGKTVRQRVDELLSVAHPDFRGELRREASRIYGL